MIGMSNHILIIGTYSKSDTKVVKTLAKELRYIEQDEVSMRYSNPKRYRDEGTGPVRLNTHVRLRPGLYSLLFISSLHPEYIYNMQMKVYEDERDL